MRWALAGAGSIVVAVAIRLAVAASPIPENLPTAEITRGEFVDIVELRGDIRPLKSVMLSAPMQSGELQIVRLARNGAAVTEGDVVVEFDGSTLRRTIQEKLTELKQAEAEIEQARAQARITEEQSRTALMKARFDLQRAELDLVERDFVARLDQERAKLAIADARQRLREAEEKERADRASSATQIAARERKVDKVKQEIALAERGLAALQLRAPADGVVSVMTNWRTSSPFGGEQEFRQGDRAWAGAQIVELPDLSAVHLAARLEEAERSRVEPGQTATVRVDAIPDQEFRATVKDISVLARVDFTSGWPPTRDFDLRLALDTPDNRLRPGMSATTRIAVGRLENVLLAPVKAVFTVDGRPTVYRLRRGAFLPQPVELLKRGRDQVVIAGGVEPGDRVALEMPAGAPGSQQ
jgi:multidrug efflux pump subunit AcrA (membrane-fusion protein)